MSLPIHQCFSHLTHDRPTIAYTILLNLLGTSPPPSSPSLSHLNHAQSAEFILTSRHFDNATFSSLAPFVPPSALHVLLLIARPNQHPRSESISAPSLTFPLPSLDPLACPSEHIWPQIFRPLSDFDPPSSPTPPSSPSPPSEPSALAASTSSDADSEDNPDDTLREYLLQLCLGAGNSHDAYCHVLTRAGERSLESREVDDLLEEGGERKVGRLGMCLRQALAVGKVFAKLSAFVAKDECEKEDKMMATIRNHLLKILRRYVSAMEQERECQDANKPLMVLCETDQWLEELLHLARVVDAVGGHRRGQETQVVDAVCERSGWYYASSGVRDLTALAVTLYLDELDERTLWKQIDEAENNSARNLGGRQPQFGYVGSRDTTSFPELVDNAAVGVLFRKWHSEKLLNSFPAADRSSLKADFAQQDKEDDKTVGLDHSHSHVVEESSIRVHEMKKPYFDLPPITPTEPAFPRQLKTWVHSDDIFTAQDQPAVDCPENTFLSMTDGLFAKGSVNTLLLKRKFVEYEDVCERLQDKLLQLFETKCHVFEHLRNLFSLALLAAGDFAEALVSQINVAAAQAERNEKFIRIRSDAGLTFYGATNFGSKLRRSNIHLQKCLTSAMNMSHLQDNLKADISLTVDEENNDDEGLWKGPLKFQYRVAEPVSAIITDESIRQYSRMFDFFLRLRRAKRILHDIYVLTKGNVRIRRALCRDPQKRRANVFLRQFCWEAHSFVNIVTEKTMQVVLRDKWTCTIDKSNPVRNLLDLNSKHHEFLSRSLRTCFLTHEHESVIGVLMGGLQVITNVAEKVSQEDYGASFYHDIEDMLRGSTASLQRRYSFFVDVLERLDGLG